MAKQKRPKLDFSIPKDKVELDFSIPGKSAPQKAAETLMYGYYGTEEKMKSGRFPVRPLSDIYVGPQEEIKPQTIRGMGVEGEEIRKREAAAERLRKKKEAAAKRREEKREAKALDIDPIDFANENSTALTYDVEISDPIKDITRTMGDSITYLALQAAEGLTTVSRIATEEGGLFPGITEKLDETKRQARKEHLDMLKKKDTQAFEEMKEYYKRRDNERAEFENWFNKTVEKPVNEKSKELIDILRENKQIVAMDAISGEQGINKTQEFIFNNTMTAGSIGTALGVWYLTKSPHAAAATLSVMEGLPHYTDARKSGVNHKGALRQTAVTTGGTYLLELVGFNYLLKGLKGPMLTRLIGAGAETGQEMTQTWWQNLVRKYGIDKSQKVFEGTWETLISTFPAVALIGGGGSAYNRVIINRATNKVANQLDVSKQEAKEVVLRIEEQQHRIRQSLAQQLKKEGKPTQFLPIENDVNQFINEVNESKRYGEAPTESAYIVVPRKNVPGLLTDGVPIEKVNQGKHTNKYSQDGVFLMNEEQTQNLYDPHIDYVKVELSMDKLNDMAGVIQEDESGRHTVTRELKSEEVSDAIVSVTRVRPSEPISLRTVNLEQEAPEAHNDIQRIKELQKIIGKKNQEGVNDVERNKKIQLLKEKAKSEGLNALTPKERKLLNEEKVVATVDGIKAKDETDEIVKEIEELYAGVPLPELKNITITYNGTKWRLIDFIGKNLINKYGLNQKARRILTQIEGSQDVRKEQLVEFFKEVFPVSKDDAKTLLYHQENPKKYSIPEELEEYAQIVEDLIEVSKRMQKRRGLQKTFFPDSFMKKNEKKIEQHKAIIPTLKTEAAKNRHLEAIEGLNEANEELKNLRYVRHLYLTSEAMERQFLKLAPEGRVSSRLRSSLTKLKGRKYATLDDAKEAGLIPEEDIRVVLAEHMEYVFRKSATYDMIETMKQNKSLVQESDEAPQNWDKVAISQLDGYRVHPLLSSSLEDMALSHDKGVIAQGYDAINHLGKSIIFYNPLILPFWNLFQGYAAGSVNPLRPIYSVKLFAQATKEVLGKGETYQEAVRNQLYGTPISGYYSPPIEHTMKKVINQMEDSYPGWKKKIETLTGEPVNWKTYLIAPAIYKASWNLTWTMDRIQRTATLMHFMNKGMSVEDAADAANTFHANYSLFTKKAKTAANRVFLVPTYKANMIANLPTYLAKQTGNLVKSKASGKSTTAEQRNAVGALFRIITMTASFIAIMAANGYRLREGYRLVKKLDEPEMDEEGNVLMERVITLPGPFFEIPKLAQRLKRGPEGLYMYMAKVPQIAWGLARNARWQGDPYVKAGDPHKMEAYLMGILKDYLSPIDRYAMMTDEQVDAFDNILSTIGLATYKRGSTERRIFYQIQNRKRDMKSFLADPSESYEDKVEAIEEAERDIQRLIDELDSYNKQFNQ